MVLKKNRESNWLNLTNMFEIDITYADGKHDRMSSVHCMREMVEKFCV